MGVDLALYIGVDMCYPDGCCRLRDGAYFVSAPASSKLPTAHQPLSRVVTPAVGMADRHIHGAVGLTHVQGY